MFRVTPIGVERERVPYNNDFWMARPLPSSVKTLFNAATQRPDFSLKKALVTLAAAAVSVAVCGLARRSCSVAQR